MKNFSEKDRLALGVLSIGFGGPRVPMWLKPYLENGLGGITLFGSNTPDLEATANLVEEIRHNNSSIVISIDEEGGDVTRIYARTGSEQPSAAQLGRIDDVDYTRASYYNLGLILNSLGIDLTFAPVADICINFKNPIVGIRSFGDRADLVSRHVDAAVRGLQAAGTSASLKHFPGHGAVLEDSHHNLPRIRSSFADLEALDLAPFLSGLKAGARSVMVGHLIVDSLDSENAASQSTRVMKDFLRQDLAYEGVIITDALDMGALGGPANIPHSAAAAIRAGADFLCLSGLPDQSSFVAGSMQRIVADIEQGQIDESNLRASADRISKLRGLRKSLDINSHLDVNTLIKGFEVFGNPKLSKNSITHRQLNGEPTAAAGQIKWGIKDALESAMVNVSVTNLDSAIDILVFRDAWRDPVMLSDVVHLAAINPECIFIDMGWPTIEFTPRNLIRTFGVGNLTSQAVVSLLLKN